MPKNSAIPPHTPAKKRLLRERRSGFFCELIDLPPRKVIPTQAKALNAGETRKEVYVAGVRPPRTPLSSTFIVERLSLFLRSEAQKVAGIGISQRSKRPPHSLTFTPTNMPSPAGKMVLSRRVSPAKRRLNSCMILVNLSASTSPATLPLRKAL